SLIESDCVSIALARDKFDSCDRRRERPGSFNCRVEQSATYAFALPIRMDRNRQVGQHVAKLERRHADRVDLAAERAVRGKYSQSDAVGGRALQELSDIGFINFLRRTGEAAAAA